MCAAQAGGGPARGPNAARHAETRTVLLRRARKIFTDSGYAEANTSDVVAGTDLTRGALYYHFPDKPTLFAAVVEEVAAEVADRITVAADQASSPFGALVKGCEAWLDAGRDREVRRILLLEGPAVLGSSRWREIDQQYGTGSLGEGIRAVLAEHPDPDLTAAALTPLLAGALNEAALRLAESEVDMGEALKANLRTLLRRLFSSAALPGQ